MRHKAQKGRKANGAAQNAKLMQNPRKACAVARAARGLHSAQEQRDREKAYTVVSKNEAAPVTVYAPQPAGKKILSPFASATSFSAQRTVQPPSRHSRE